MPIDHLLRGVLCCLSEETPESLLLKERAEMVEKEHCLGRVRHDGGWRVR